VNFKGRERLELADVRSSRPSGFVTNGRQEWVPKAAMDFPDFRLCPRSKELIATPSTYGWVNWCRANPRKSLSDIAHELHLELVKPKPLVP
jgi:hypothetical protein